MERFSVLILLLFFCLGCKTDQNDIVKTEIKEATADTIFPQKKYLESITKDFVLGKFNYRVDSTFTKVDLKYSSKEIYLKKETYRAFLKMFEAAKIDGISLQILSGTRNFKEQKAIWERKWLKYKKYQPKERSKKILEYSSMPSTSRHHWGTDLDLNSLNNSYFNSGKGKQEYDWLVANANSYGFYQVYTPKDRGRTGYNLEKWHWSYLPLASKYLEFYNTNISLKDINDFQGYDLAEELKIIDNYVNGIAKKAKHY